MSAEQNPSDNLPSHYSNPDDPNNPYLQLFNKPDDKFVDEREREMRYVMREYMAYREQNGHKIILDSPEEILDKTKQLITTLEKPNSARLLVGLPYHLLHELNEKMKIEPEEILRNVGMEPERFRILSNNFEQDFQQTIKNQTPPPHFKKNPAWEYEWQEKGKQIIANSEARIQS